MILMISINEIKRGNIIKNENDIWLVTFAEQVKPGKGSAFTRTKLKSLTRGTVVEKTFKEVDKIEDVEVEKRKMSYSYEDKGDLIFFDNEDYEQYTIDRELVEDISGFMKENMEVEVNIYEGKPISIIPPNFTVLEVTYAEEGLKGDTSGTARKQVEVETGGKINVPIFVKQGDKIKIDLRTISYVERVK
jgi:elongation factor P